MEKNATCSPPTTPHTYTPPSLDKEPASIPKCNDIIIHNAELQGEKVASFLQSSLELSYTYEPTGG